MATSAPSETYAERLAEVRKRMLELPFGARSSASFDLRIAPSVVSAVLNGKAEREDVLEKLHAWLEDATPESVARRKDTAGAKNVAADRFVSEAFTPDPNGSVTIDAAYDQYVAWAKTDGEQPLSRWPFVAVMRVRYPLVRLNDEKVFVGVRLG